MGHAAKPLDELLKLSAEERSLAAETLLISLETDDAEADVDAAWDQEIQRRITENAPGVSAESVFAEARTRLTNRQ